MPASDRRGAVEATHKVDVEIRTVFDSLVKDETKDGISYRAYAHHLARACWHSGWITLRQTSPQAEGIFDLILELHRGCSGRWDDFRDRGITQEDLNTWLEFAGMFLSNFGNHFVGTY
jgi:dipeptidyl-peptidase-3